MHSILVGFSWCTKPYISVGNDELGPSEVTSKDVSKTDVCLTTRKPNKRQTVCIVLGKYFAATDYRTSFTGSHGETFISNTVKPSHYPMSNQLCRRSWEIYLPKRLQNYWSVHHTPPPTSPRPPPPPPPSRVYVTQRKLIWKPWCHARLQS